ncbi:MAG: hypothetical protein SOZ34_05930 [Clostridia bacterium]|nr:hypothetical protein [Clostridia bacterium]
MFQKLKEENQKLWNKNMSLEKEIEDLKFQVSASALIISELESKIEVLKAENKNLLKQINNTSKSSAEINNRPPLASNLSAYGLSSSRYQNADDDNGNQISKSVVGTDNIETFTYNKLNRLTEYNNGITSVHYAYISFLHHPSLPYLLFDAYKVINHHQEQLSIINKL